MSEHKGANAALYLRCLAHHNKATRDAMTRTGSPVAALADFVSGELAAEREACAKVADDMGGPFIECDAHGDGYRAARADIAAAIRGRGKA